MISNSGQCCFSILFLFLLSLSLSFRFFLSSLSLSRFALPFSPSFLSLLKLCGGGGDDDDCGDGRKQSSQYAYVCVRACTLLVDKHTQQQNEKSTRFFPV